MVERYKTDGTATETLAEAKRALTDPDFPADLRERLAGAMAQFEHGRDEAVAFFQAGNAGPGTPEWDHYLANYPDGVNTQVPQ